MAPKKSKAKVPKKTKAAATKKPKAAAPKKSRSRVEKPTRVQPRRGGARAAKAKEICYKEVSEKHIYRDSSPVAPKESPGQEAAAPASDTASSSPYTSPSPEAAAAPVPASASPHKSPSPQAAAAPGPASSSSHGSPGLGTAAAPIPVSSSPRQGPSPETVLPDLPSTSPYRNTPSPEADPANPASPRPPQRPSPKAVVPADLASQSPHKTASPEAGPVNPPSSRPPQRPSPKAVLVDPPPSRPPQRPSPKAIVPADYASDNTPPPAQSNNNGSAPPEDPSDPSEGPEAPEGPPSPLKPDANGDYYHAADFPPEFWNSLSTVWLTKRSLRELDRRNRALPTPVLKRPKVRPRSFAAWAMHGGPDTRHLRGYEAPNPQESLVRRGNTYKAHKRAEPLSAYDANLEQWLLDNGIYTLAANPHPQRPVNLINIQAYIERPCPGLGPRFFTEEAFKTWKAAAKKPERAKTMTEVFGAIIGATNTCRGRDLQFVNLAPLAGDVAPVVPAPTAFDASQAAWLHQGALDVMAHLIAPVQGGEFIAPNFFVEASGEKGGAPGAVGGVEDRRACYHGALGARAMHAMQNYGGEEWFYERAAHAFSATWTWEEGLTLYAHHVTAPDDPDGRGGGWPEYHMTKLGTWDMKRSRKRFADGASAFRNLVEMAAGFREHLIAQVNDIEEAESGEGVKGDGDEGVEGESLEDMEGVEGDGEEGVEGESSEAMEGVEGEGAAGVEAETSEDMTVEERIEVESPERVDGENS